MEYPLQRPEPGKWASAAFSVLMHALLLGALFWGVQWQRRTPEPVSVELVRAAPAPMAEPRPEPEAVKPPPPAPKPVEEVKAPEPKPVVKPDIALKEPEKKKPEKKPEPPKPEPPKVEKKPEVKPAPEKKPEAPKMSEMERRLEQEARKAQDAQARSQQQQNEERLAKMLSTEGNKAAAAANIAAMGKASKDWSDRIAAKIKPNISKPPGLNGNPIVEFEVDLVSGNTGASLIGEPKLVKSSGNPTLDEAVKRGILKSDPLPMPLKTEAFERRVRLVFKPMEE